MGGHQKQPGWPVKNLTCEGLEKEAILRSQKRVGYLGLGMG